MHFCFHSERQFLSLPVAPLAPTRVSLDEFSRTIHESPAVYLVDKGRILLLVPLHGPLLRLRKHVGRNPVVILDAFIDSRLRRLEPVVT